MGALILNHTLRKERLIRPVTHALSKNCAKIFQQQLRIQHNPLQRALRAFWPKAGQRLAKRPLFKGIAPQITEILSYTYMQVHRNRPVVTPLHIFCAIKVQPGSATHRQPRGQRTKYGFPVPAKTGTIAPFFIKAPALEMGAGGHWRDSPLQRCDTCPHPSRLPRPTLLAAVRTLC